MVAFATIHRGMTRESQCVMETSHIQSGIPVTISFFQMMLNHKWLIWSRNQPGYDHWPPWIWSGRLAKECAYIGRCKRFTYPLGILQKAYYCHTSEPTIAWIQLRYGLCKHMKLMVVVANWFSTCLIWYFHWYSGFPIGQCARVGSIAHAMPKQLPLAHRWWVILGNTHTKRSTILC